MTFPNDVPQTQTYDIGASSVVTTVVTNGSTGPVRYTLSANTQAYLSSFNTVSAAAGLYIGPGDVLNIVVPANNSIYAFSSNAVEITVQEAS